MAQAEVFYMDDMQSATDALFIAPSLQTRQYLNDNFTQYINNVSGVNSNFGNILMEKYHEINNSETMRQLELVKSHANRVWKPSEVEVLSTLEDFQYASPVMQRWILASPVIGHLVNNHALSGYNDSFEGKRYLTFGRDNYDYRRVTDGMIVEDNHDVINRQYIESVEEADLLSIVEKRKIIASWNMIEELLQDSNNIFDPTSVWGGNL